MKSDAQLIQEAIDMVGGIGDHAEALERLRDRAQAQSAEARCAAKHDGFQCEGPAGHVGPQHWWGAMTWPAEARATPREGLERYLVELWDEFPLVERLKVAQKFPAMLDPVMAALRSSAEAQCVFGDPACPCQDGDPCHYVDRPGSPAMTPSAEAPPAPTEQRLREALVKVRAHTSYVNPTVQLLSGLLFSIERIVDAALSAPKGED